MWSPSLLALPVGVLLRTGTLLLPVPAPGGESSACPPLERLAAADPAVAVDVWQALASHNGAVRWDLARGEVRVWVQPRPADAVTFERPDRVWRQAVAEAAAEWRDVVPGLGFAMVRDSAAADVVVTWAGELGADPAAGPLASRSAGRTTLVPDDEGRAVRADVRLAVDAPTGERYSVADVRAVARHELGHVLGLAHHASAQSVMAPLVAADRLADGDRTALRALYALPVGARCALPATLVAAR